ncbi:hypothetical protein CTI16_10125 [Prevotella intermedia]|uniref:Uncharacterized protein n=1 Tax=Prevotella intermedia TaxID=28131 RepID=A0AAJ3V8T7_PREIN|nr:hypothetical protein CUB95_10310 [Prevotella intermedia]PIK17353.1 hypothetical protein CTI16_10125 [Prevotella intermedia]
MYDFILIFYKGLSNGKLLRFLPNCKIRLSWHCDVRTANDTTDMAKIQIKLKKQKLFVKVFSIMEKFENTVITCNGPCAFYLS